MASIPIGATIGASLGRVFGHLNQVFAVVLPYAVLQIVVGVIATFVLLPILFTTTGWILFAIFLLIILLIYTAMLVAWHRVTLLGYGADKGLFRVGLGPREWRFLGYSLLVYPLMIVIALIWYAAGGLVALLGIAASIFLIVRFCLVLPATAADHPTSLKTSWQQTSGHFWSMFAVFVVLFLIFFVVLLIIATILTVVLGQGMAGSFIQQLVLIPVQLVGICVSVSAVSYMYRILSGHPDPLAETP